MIRGMQLYQPRYAKQRDAAGRMMGAAI